MKQLKDIRAQFQVMSSNYHHTKSDYEKMKEISDMKYLMDHYPEEFPNISAGGRVVEHLAKQLGMKRSTVSEYLSMEHNLIAEGKELLEQNEINKSSAVALASLPAKEQKQLIEQGNTSLKEIKQHKEKKRLQKLVDECSHKLTKEELLEDLKEVIYALESREVVLDEAKYLEYLKYVQAIKNLI